MRVVICALIGHYTEYRDKAKDHGMTAHCDRCGRPVKWLLSFGWLVDWKAK